MPVVTLPFAAADLPDLPQGPSYQVWTPGDPVDHLGATEFRMAPYPPFVGFAPLVRHMPPLGVLQMQTADVDAVADVLRPEPALCRASGLHGAPPAEMAMTQSRSTRGIRCGPRPAPWITPTPVAVPRRWRLG